MVHMCTNTQAQTRSHVQPALMRVHVPSLRSQTSQSVCHFLSPNSLGEAPGLSVPRSGMEGQTLRRMDTQMVPTIPGCWGGDPASGKSRGSSLGY